MISWIAEGILLLIFCAAFINCWKRGLIRSLSRLLSLIGAWLCARNFYFVLDGILNRRCFLPLLRDYVRSALDSAAGQLDMAAEQVNLALVQAAAAIETRFSVLGLFRDTAPSVTLDNMTTEEVLTSFTTRIADPVAERLSEIAAFLVIFILAYFVFQIAFWLVGLVCQLPILHGVNHGLGGLFGVVLGLIDTFLAAQVISLIFHILCANGTLPPDTAAGPLLGFFGSFGA